MNTKAKQTISKRDQVKKAGSTVFIVVAISSVIVMFSLISMRFLWEKKSYNDRVITAKTKARNDISTNLENLDKLSEQFPDLNSSASTNSKTILHALPPTYDYAALASSIDYLAAFSGVQSNTSIGEDISASAVNSASVSEPVELPLTMQVNGSYDSIKQYITNLERSIRPINVSTVTYSGSNDLLQATIQAVTYYQPARSLDVLRSPIQ
jgi:Tfp pilus assembly protein PilO